MAKNIIEHKGKIDSIEGNRIKIHFLNISACASCHAKGVCTASDMENKEVEVTDYSGNFNTGEEVRVLLQQSLGFKALLWGYVVPFLVVLTGLFVLSSLTNNEVIAGVGALSLLVPYYIALYLLKERIKKVFSFTIQKIDK
jgi:sigma-E factor negative regulatory protein RseC